MVDEDDKPASNFGMKEEHLHSTHPHIQQEQSMEDFFGNSYNLLIEDGWNFSTYVTYDTQDDPEANKLLQEAFGIMTGEIKKFYDQTHAAVMEAYEFLVYKLEKNEDYLEIDSRSGQMLEKSPNFPNALLDQISSSITGFRNEES
ncbi:MAG: hypothetical protein CL562_09465 [Alphaproteobacteria bacterium]|nr:hypothetical protein [Alphaproteobacteria bacterium]